MRSYRILLCTTVLLVGSAVIGFPATVLYRHHHAVAALKRTDSVSLFTEAPPYSKFLKLECYDNLFQTVDDAYLFGTVHPVEMRHVKNLRGLKAVTFEDVDESAWPYLPSQLESLQFNVSSNRSYSMAWRQIAGLKQLKEFSIYGDGGAIDETLAPMLGQLPALKNVRLRDLQLSHATLETLLTQKPDLELLDISQVERDGYELTDKDVELISRHRGIKTLDIAGNCALTDASLRSLAKMPSLKRLDFSHTDVNLFFNGEQPPTIVTSSGTEALRKLRPDLEINRPGRRF